jgi:tetratricopeptide (TPR) repeat protein
LKPAAKARAALSLALPLAALPLAALPGEAAALAAGAAALAGCGSAQARPSPSAVQRLNGEGLRRLERGDGDGAEEMFRDALREGELVDDLQGQAEAWNNLGALASGRGKAEQAWAFHAAALRLHAARKVRDAGEVRTRTNLGGAMLLAGKPGEAKQQFQEATTLAASIGDAPSAYMARVGSAAVALREGDIPLAARLAREVAADARRTGAASDEGALAAALSVEGAALELLHDTAGAKARFDEALTIDRRREQPLAVSADLRSLARLAERQGELGEAASLLGRSARISRRMGQLDEAAGELQHAIKLADQGSATGEAAALRAELEAVEEARRSPRR